MITSSCLRLRDYSQATLYAFDKRRNVFPRDLADLLGKSPSGTVRGAALPVDQLTNDIGEKFRLVKRNKVAALVGEYLPAVCRQGGQPLLQF